VSVQKRKKERSTFCLLNHEKKEETNDFKREFQESTGFLRKEQKIFSSSFFMTQMEEVWIFIST
jgi:hypothetical protein